MRVICQSQHTPEWDAARLGRATASRAADILSTLKIASKNGKKGDPSGDQLNYMKQLVIEHLTGMRLETFVTSAMEAGTEFEPRARAEYQYVKDVEGERIGFILHPTVDSFGCSPDLLIGNDGGAEFKCPQPMKHLSCLSDYAKAMRQGLKGNALAEFVIPEENLWQVHANILCCEREWWDWASYAAIAPSRGYPRFPKELRLLTIRVYRDEAKIKELTEGIESFCERLMKVYEDVNALRELMAVAA